LTEQRTDGTPPIFTILAGNPSKASSITDPPTASSLFPVAQYMVGDDVLEASQYVLPPFPFSEHSCALR